MESSEPDYDDDEKSYEVEERQLEETEETLATIAITSTNQVK